MTNTLFDVWFLVNASKSIRIYIEWVYATEVERERERNGSLRKRNIITFAIFECLNTNWPSASAYSASCMSVSLMKLEQHKHCYLMNAFFYPVSAWNARWTGKKASPSANDQSRYKNQVISRLKKSIIFLFEKKNELKEKKATTTNWIYSLASTYL